MSEEQPSAKKAKLEAKYELLYWPGMPGRGEFVRLALEAAGLPYKDTTNEEKDGITKLFAVIRDTDINDPPTLCPPILRVSTADASPLLICQTPNILLYLGDREGLAPGSTDKYLVHQHALTALDLTNEAHNTHHPIDVALFYEDQKPEAARAAAVFRAQRIPKFFGYFDRVLRHNKRVTPGAAEKPWGYVVGDKLTYADTTVWQMVDGVAFAFPERVQALRDGGGYADLFAFYDGLKSEAWLAEYLGSERRQKYSHGIFRHYEELDGKE
ncbi:hypothetical protein DRE_01560 [Drechslerella stenobrocha 248]|uniref:Glutathione S-transferase n=1 Tax=Drechslerella stenobrocha 248 TaxID=1043628 RepID=W7HV02_9PEZI|nr:hypothetical protein DRE_01560 [Drechslerella stenobrocha 248]